MFQTPLAFDVDNDGITEIITSTLVPTQNYIISSNNLLILDGKSTKIKHSFPTAFYCAAATLSILPVDINNDCIPEFIFAALDDNINELKFRGKLICYDINGNVLWISNKEYGSAFSTFRYGGALGSADFNNDGLPEVYIYNEIFNAQSGVILCAGGNFGVGQGNAYSGRNANSLAINVDDEPNDLELVAGYTVYKVDIQNIQGETGNVMTPNNVNINGKYLDGLTAFADLNNDGINEIIISSNASQSISGLYVYTFRNGVYTLLSGPYNFYPNELWDTGLPMVVKLEMNDEMRCFLSGDNNIMSLSASLDASINLEQEISVFERSNKLGVTSFDLDGDGTKEIIYRDEKELKIFKQAGSAIQLIANYTCSSVTIAEMPIVAALEKNGEARICVTCMDSNNQGRLTIFGPPPGQHWAPALNIWHQYAYNPLFINDDGTVPQYMHNPATYKNGKYNNFMVQESLLDEDGNYPVAAASLTGDITCIDYDAAQKTYTITFGVENRADASRTAAIGTPVSFYSGNPESGGTLLFTYQTDADIPAGMRIVRTVTIPETAMTTLWMVVNTDKYPITLADSSHYNIDECDYTDNVFQTLMPYKDISTQEICSGDTYDFYGQSLSTAGTYTHQITNSAGCDSVIVELQLELKACNLGCGQDTTLCYGLKKFESDFEIQMEKKWESSVKIPNVQSPIVIDVDNDCESEIIVLSANLKNSDWFAVKDLLIFNSKNLSLKYKISTDYITLGGSNFIIVDIDKDGIYEIIVANADIPINPLNLAGKLICYQLDGTIKWVSDTKYSTNLTNLQVTSLNAADFDNNGFAEIYINNTIFNASSGKKLADGGLNGMGTNGYFTISSVGNFDDNPNDLELAAGYTIYDVIITNSNGTLGNSMVPYNLSIDGIFYDGRTMVSDINEDGRSDVLICTSNSFFSGIYIYNLQNLVPKLIAMKTWNRFVSLGMTSIGQTGNFSPKIIYSDSDTLYCLSYNGSLVLKDDWKYKIDDKSGNLGISLFDFNGDRVQKNCY